jgi:hypothetical protein
LWPFTISKERINPIEATKAGFNGYNDTITNYISDSYQEYLKKAYGSFLKELENYALSELSTKDGLSKRVMGWDCRIKL